VRSRGLCAAEQDEVWRRARRLGKRGRRSAPLCSRPVAYNRTPRRGPRGLSMTEREKISRSIAAGESCRRIACRLGRAPSTVSRELARNGGRHHYRAQVADAAAFRRASGPSRPSWRSSRGCGRWSRPSWPWGGRRSRSPAGCRWLPSGSGCCGCRTRRSSCRCSSSAGVRWAASSSAVWAPVGRCALRGASGWPRDAVSCATPSTSASDPPRRPTGRCPAIGKATWSSASGPARWAP
jgi:DNA-binding CsgD family transcriptional regulator